MVDASSHIRLGHPITFGLLTFFSFIVAVIASTITSGELTNALSAPLRCQPTHTCHCVIADFNSNNNSQSSSITGSVRFLTFTGWWTFLFSIAYLALFLTGIGGVLTSIASHGAWLFLTWLFFMAGAGALTASMGGGQNCSTTDLLYCPSMEALMAFSWMCWILLTFMLAAVLFIGGTAFRGGRSVKEGLNEA